ncbi:MAG: peptide MFS transporter [Francisella sp.]
MNNANINNRNIQKDLPEEKKILVVASLAEFAERYGYYIIQALLIFYLIDEFKFTEKLSDSLVGTIISMVYISSILGGFIAERYIGYYRSGLLGALLMFSGFFLLTSSTNQNLLFLSLSFISISTGLIKPNMSAFIGQFYDKANLNNSRRDFGFNIFYMFINLGSFIALLISRRLADNYGYVTPFYSAVIVSFFMFCLLCIGLKYLNKYVAEIKITLSIFLKVTFLIGLYIAILFQIFKYPTIASLAAIISLIAASIILTVSIKFSSFKRVLTAGLFFIASLVYWALFFQSNISIYLFIQYSVNTSLLNSSEIISIEALSVLFFALIVGKFWLYLDKKGIKINYIDKFIIAFVLITITFLIVLLTIMLSQDNYKVSAYGFIFAYILLGISDLSLSATGLSMVTKIAPKGFVSLYMGIWLIIIGLGGKLGGYISSLFYISETNLALSKANMSNGLITFIVLSLLSILLILLFRKFINKNI